MPSREIADRKFLRCASGRTDGAMSVGLPPDLIEKAGRRVGIAALIYSGAYLLAYGSARILEVEGQATGPFPQMPDVMAAIFIAISVAFYFFARSGRVSDERLLDVGLVYLVVAAAGIDQYLLWGTFAEGTLMTGISWVGVWIVSFSLLVPSTTGKMLIASLVAASTTPLLYVVGRATGAPPLVNMTQVFIANYICAGIAVAASRVVFNLGTDLGNALRMGSYQLVEKLGAGGMGEVWKAEHRMLARPAAIKLVTTRSGSSSSAASSPEKQRLEREVQATAQLRSPHTVEVYDYGLADDGRFYYVMELLDGMDLEQLVERYGPMPAERVVYVLEQMCHSLAEAHERGLVHRDVKPANIFLCRYGRDLDFVKVLDFGLVKHSDERSRGDAKLTEVGGFAGTPAYGSPESAEGGDTEVDARSDIYSLGCVAYWLLTGSTVFEASSPMLMLVQHLHTEPAPPSAAAPGDVPLAMDELILSCLQKRAADRPASADEVAERLRGIRFDCPWSAERARAWWAGAGTVVASPAGAAVS
jgi:hypothetical protein